MRQQEKFHNNEKYPSKNAGRKKAILGGKYLMHDADLKLRGQKRQYV